MVSLGLTCNSTYSLVFGVRRQNGLGHAMFLCAEQKPAWHQYATLSSECMILLNKRQMRQRDKESILLGTYTMHQVHAGSMPSWIGPESASDRLQEVCLLPSRVAL